MGVFPLLCSIEVRFVIFILYIQSKFFKKYLARLRVKPDRKAGNLIISILNEGRLL